jgi:glycosyltransferase involved in cell wall biosynthesis
MTQAEPPHPRQVADAACGQEVPAMRIVVAVLAHNEERRIAACLASLPLGHPGVEMHVVVNGSTDRTADIARGFPGVTVHEYRQGGKSRSWNRFMLDTPGIEADCYVLVDGDAEIAPGSVFALAGWLAAHPAANAASGLPCNGRSAAHYRAAMLREHGLFGDLYALSGSFVARLRQSGIRLPDDLIGDDGLIAALAKTDLGNEDDWQDRRVMPCPQAGFLCEPTRLSPASLRIQYRRMINYALRHFQGRIITTIMRGPGPAALPRELAALYADHLAGFRARAHPQWWWFDRLALRRMRNAA